MVSQRHLGFDKNFNIKIIPQPKKNQKKKSLFALVNASNLGYYIITPLITGVFLGYIIDKKTGSNFFVILGIIIGGVCSIYNLFRLTK